MILFLLACDPTGGDSAETGEIDRAPLILALTPDSAAGTDIFGGFCTSCHGYLGEGDIGPALTNVVPGATREHLVDVVLNGYDGPDNGSLMSGLPSLTDQNIADVVDYVMITWGTVE